MQIPYAASNQSVNSEDLGASLKTNLEKLEAEVLRRGNISDIELNNTYRTPFASNITRLERQISNESSAIRKAFSERIEINSAKISQLKQLLGSDINVPLNTYSDLSELERVVDTLETNRQTELNKLIRQHQLEKSELVANYEATLVGLMQ